ncbi:MAG: hypothetical protein BMS9Abin02_0532 [Anaerolineae bacterium]|nr:MAG: hypothetical protein BMS9Abin02_0532 [Anaerolineae bacterium]
MSALGPENESINYRRLEANLPNTIQEAARLLKDGQLIVFPTDTVYGVGADCFNKPAIMNLYKAKRRSLKKGLPILLSDYRDIGKVVAELSNYAELLIDRFWPGPLTLILRKREDLPHLLSPNDGIGVRIPDNDITRAFIRASGGAIASSSANIAGKAPPRDANEVGAALAEHIAAIIDGGRVGGGQPSTVVDCREDPPLILRRGPISLEQILLSSKIHP